MFASLVRAKAGAVLATAAVLAAGGLGHPHTPAEAAATPGMTFVGHNPASLAQPTVYGKVITAMQVHDGRVYLGIGDWNSNTGPIPVVSYDPESRAFVEEFRASTEAVHRFAVLSGKLYAPYTDRRGTTDYAVLDGAGTWSERGGMSATHLFDMASHDGADLVGVGSSGSSAVAWRSTNGGSSWSKSLVLAPASAGGVSRFYDVWSLGGTTWVQANDARTARSFDGSAWSASTLDFASAAMQRPVRFADRLVGSGSYGGNGVFDGASFARLPYSGPNAVAGDTLYTLHLATGVVYATKDLRSWSAVTQAPRDGVSIAASTDGAVYVGTSAGALWSHAPTVADEPTPGPSQPTPTPSESTPTASPTPSPTPSPSESTPTASPTPSPSESTPTASPTPSPSGSTPTPGPSADPAPSRPTPAPPRAPIPSTPVPPVPAVPAPDVPTGPPTGPVGDPLGRAVTELTHLRTPPRAAQAHFAVQLVDQVSSTPLIGSAVELTVSRVIPAPTGRKLLSPPSVKPIGGFLAWTDSGGVASVSLPLPAGRYQVHARFRGDREHQPAEVSATTVWHCGVLCPE